MLPTYEILTDALPPTVFLPGRRHADYTTSVREILYSHNQKEECAVEVIRGEGNFASLSKHRVNKAYGRSEDKDPHILNLDT
jgi:hypothetical protein